MYGFGNKLVCLSMLECLLPTI